MIKSVFFDLDGTLLPMDMEEFIKSYFTHMMKKMVKHGYEAETLPECIWAGTEAMVKNDGSKTNEEVFWERFSKVCGRDCKKDEPVWEDFYRNEFLKTKEACGVNPLAKKTVELCKELGLDTVLATNPLFPRIATKNRITFTGMTLDDFSYTSVYENSHYAKPNPAYYTEILEKLGKKPEECLMVGNDVKEDMVASTVNMKVFLVTDCLLNPEGEDISKYPNGTFEDLMQYIRELAGK